MDESTKVIVSAVDFYFIEESGERFKVSALQFFLLWLIPCSAWYYFVLYDFVSKSRFTSFCVGTSLERGSTLILDHKMHRNESKNVRDENVRHVYVCGKYRRSPMLAVARLKEAVRRRFRVESCSRLAHPSSSCLHFLSFLFFVPFLLAHLPLQ